MFAGPVLCSSQQGIQAEKTADSQDDVEWRKGIIDPGFPIGKQSAQDKNEGIEQTFYQDGTGHEGSPWIFVQEQTCCNEARGNQKDEIRGKDHGRGMSALTDAGRKLPCHTYHKGQNDPHASDKYGEAEQIDRDCCAGNRCIFCLCLLP